MTTVYTSEEVAKHNTKNDLWMSIHGHVYDLTSYMEDHPGGAIALLEVAGQDATVAFEDLGHTDDAREKMGKFVVGKLDHEDAPPARVQRQLTPVPEDPPKHYLTDAGTRTLVDVLITTVVVALGFSSMHRFRQSTSARGWQIPQVVVGALPWALSTAFVSLLFRRTWERTFPTKVKAKLPAHFKVQRTVAVPSHSVSAVLQPREYIDLPITSIEKLSDDSNKIIVDLPTKTSVLGLPIGQHISIRSTIDGTPVSRSYTPTSSNKDLGRLELVIKNYDTGVLTGKYLKDVKVGDKLSVSGPKGQMRYRRGLAKNIGMIAGGTGITPMYQLVRSICEDERDNTKVVLLYANQREQDILLRAELDQFVAEHSEQLEVHYLLSKPDSDWTGKTGRVTKDLVQQSFAPADDKQNKVMICGPQGMVDGAKEWLVDLGFDHANAVCKMADQVFVF